MSEAEMQSNGYPADLDVALPEQSSRLLAVLLILFFVKSLLLIPHLVALVIYEFVSGITAWVTQWIVLFTGRYPPGVHGFILGYSRWNWRVFAWLSGLTDRYPPFSEPDGEYPAWDDCAVPESSSRLLAVVRILVVPLGIVLIPPAVALGVLLFVAFQLTYLAQWGTLFTGSFPRSFVPLIVGPYRWNHRLYCYSHGLVDSYPPFRLDS